MISSFEQKSKTLLQAGAVIFHLDDPRRIIWRGALPIWQGVVADSHEHTRPIKPLGFAILNNHFILYWLTVDNSLIVVKTPSIVREKEDARLHPKILDRHHGNPVIEPISKLLGK